MKPFDLEAAKLGVPICNEKGAHLTLVAHVEGATETQRVVCLHSSGEILKFNEYGKSSYANGLPLFMAPTTRTVWVNFYADNTRSVKTLLPNYGDVYETEKIADAADAERLKKLPESLKEILWFHRIGGKAFPLEIEA